MPRPRPKTLVANSLEELEALNRLHANPPLRAGGDPMTDPDEIDPEEPDEVEPEEPDEDDDHENPDEPVGPAIPVDPAPTPRPPANLLVRITDSWVYPGNLQGRPPFVDPSWAAYAFYDEFTRLPSSPALRVPTPTGDKLARPGDYVVLQTTSPDIPPTVDVWSKSDFERLFPKPVVSALSRRSAA